MKLFNLISMKATELNATLEKYLKEVLGSKGINYTSNSIFGQMVTVVQAITQNILSYIEDSLTEQSKYTAQRKRSVMNLATIGGYEASLGKAATCNLTLCYIPNNEQELDVVLKHKTKIGCANNGLTYNVILPQEAIVLNINKTNASKELFCVEGSFEEQSFKATGGEYYSQEVNIKGDVDLDYLEVYVNDIPYSRVDSLYDMKPLGYQYECKPSYKDGIVLTFGNNEQGLQIYENDVIRVVYLKHSGEYGNISHDEPTVFAFKELLHDVSGDEVDGNEIFNLALTNQSAITNGTFSETAGKIKKMIGYNSRSNVLSDPKNYKLALSRYSFVGYNRTWSEVGSLIINSLVLKNYKMLVKDGGDYFELTEPDYFLSDEQKNSIKVSIANSGHQLAGVTYNIMDAKLKKYSMYCYVTLKDTAYDETYIENAIKKCVGEFFCDVDNDMFIPKSDIISKIKSDIEGIDSVDIYFMSKDNEDALRDGYYITKEKVYDLVSGTFIEKDTKVTLADGEDPGLGLDEHGNIYLQEEDTFPVLMGGWEYKCDNNNEFALAEPIQIVFQYK